MAVRSPKRMTDGGWKVALYLDDRASAEQSEALGAVFSGGAGGYLARLAPLIGEVAGVEPAAITFEKSDGSLHAEVSGALSMSADQLVGMDGQGPAVITNALRRCPAACPAGHGKRRELSRSLERGFLGNEQLRHGLPLRRLTRAGRWLTRQARSRLCASRRASLPGRGLSWWRWRRRRGPSPSRRPAAWVTDLGRWVLRGCP